MNFARGNPFLSCIPVHRPDGATPREAGAEARGRQGRSRRPRSGTAPGQVQRPRAHHRLPRRGSGGRHPPIPERQGGRRRAPRRGDRDQRSGRRARDRARFPERQLRRRGPFLRSQDQPREHPAARGDVPGVQDRRRPRLRRDLRGRGARGGGAEEGAHAGVQGGARARAGDPREGGRAVQEEVAARAAVRPQPRRAKGDRGGQGGAVEASRHERADPAAVHGAAVPGRGVRRRPPGVDGGGRARAGGARGTRGAGRRAGKGDRGARDDGRGEGGGLGIARGGDPPAPGDDGCGAQARRGDVPGSGGGIAEGRQLADGRGFAAWRGAEARGRARGARAQDPAAGDGAAVEGRPDRGARGRGRAGPGPLHREGRGARSARTGSVRLPGEDGEGDGVRGRGPVLGREARGSPRGGSHEGRPLALHARGEGEGGPRGGGPRGPGGPGDHRDAKGVGGGVPRPRAEGGAGHRA